MFRRSSPPLPYMIPPGAWEYTTDAVMNKELSCKHLLNVYIAL